MKVKTYLEYVELMKYMDEEPSEENYFNEPPCYNMWRELHDITPDNAEVILALYDESDWYWFPFCGIKCHRYWCEDHIWPDEEEE